MNGHFSKQSTYYAKSRPKYPSALFDFISSLCQQHHLAWDCATGNGQAALSLTNYFDTIFATDFSPQQISNATLHPKIIYQVQNVEECSLENHSVDLITVATAAHWFNHSSFYAQVNRVLKANGVLAIWSYGGTKISPAIDDIINPFAFELLEPYWPPETKLNWLYKYETLPFPYPLITAPPFTATASMNLDLFCNYLFSWSAVQQYINRHKKNPVELIYDNLKKQWGNPKEEKEIIWDLFMKCGRKPA